MDARRCIPAVAVVVLGLAAGACGGGGGGPTVAHIGSTTTTAAAATGSRSNGPSLAQATAFASCMRAHGVPGFPDPTPGPNGGFGFALKGPSLGASRAKMNAAQKTCNHLLPNQGVGPNLTAAQQQAFLNWAACIRAHGEPNFADPRFSGGGVQISLSGGAGLPGGKGPSPQFQAATKACKSKLPGGFAGGPLGG